jgi:hypothetical protein
MPANKANLTDFLSSSLMEKGKRLEKGEVITAGGFSDELKAESTTGRNVHKLRSNHEEADTRIILHALEAKDCGYKRTVVICKDTECACITCPFQTSPQPRVVVANCHIKRKEINILLSLITTLPIKCTIFQHFIL